MDIQEFIEDNIDLIDDENFNELYAQCTSREQQSSLTDTLYACGIDPLAHMTEVPKYFAEGTNLTHVHIPDNITSIDESAFVDCKNLKSAMIGNGVSSITRGTFKGCRALANVSIGSSVSGIEQYAFWGCSGLTNITIPNNVERIGCGAFMHCTGLVSMTVPFVGMIKDETRSDYTDFRRVFGNPYGFTGGDIPPSLKKVVITGGTTIGSHAFSEASGLASITIPNSITIIGALAFNSCSSLTSIDYLGTQAEWDAILKHEQWAQESAIKQINCSDGIIKLR